MVMFTLAVGRTVYGYIRINTATHTFNGVKVTVKVVRESLLCRLTSRSEFIIIGNTIHVRGRFLTGKILTAAMKKFETRPVWRQLLWNVISKNS